MGWLGAPSKPPVSCGTRGSPWPWVPALCGPRRPFPPLLGADAAQLWDQPGPPAGSQAKARTSILAGVLEDPTAHCVRPAAWGVVLVCPRGYGLPGQPHPSGSAWAEGLVVCWGCTCTGVRNPTQVSSCRQGRWLLDAPAKNHFPGFASSQRSCPYLHFHDPQHAGWTPGDSEPAVGTPPRALQSPGQVEELPPGWGPWGSVETMTSRAGGPWWARYPTALPSHSRPRSRDSF